MSPLWTIILNQETFACDQVDFLEDHAFFARSDRQGPSEPVAANELKPWGIGSHL